MNKPRILTLDIETAPTLAYVWRAWKQNISSVQIVDNSYILSIAAKWLDSEEILYKDNRGGYDGDDLLKWIAELLDEADIIIAHNGQRFDEPWIIGELARLKINPPSPYKIVDTLLTARKHFNFIHNSLDHLCKVFKLKRKSSHAKFVGFKLWIECLANNPAAWDEMEKYNVQDIIILEELYLRILPWMKNHPNMGVYMESDVPVCPKCGSKHVHFRGYTHTNVSKFRRFQCQDCGGWGRARQTEYPKERRATLLVNAL